MRRPSRALLTGVCSALLLTAAAAAPTAASAAIISPGDYPTFVVPRPVPPSIGIRVGHGYRHAEQWPRICELRSHGVPTTVDLTMKPLPRGLSLSFFSMDDPDVKRFRVSAVSQTLHAGRNAVPTWKTVAVPNGCRQITATITGLTKGDYYTVWVDAIMVRRLGAPGTMDRTVGRMGAFQAG